MTTTWFGYLISISIDFLQFYFSVFFLVLGSVSLTKSKIGFLNPKTDFTFLY